MFNNPLKHYTSTGPRADIRTRGLISQNNQSSSISALSTGGSTSGSSSVHLLDGHSTATGAVVISASSTLIEEYQKLLYPIFGASSLISSNEFANATSLGSAIGTAALVQSTQSSQAGSLDPYWNNVVTLLHMNGSNNSILFTDVKGRTWNNFNSVISTSTSKFGGASGNFNYYPITTDARLDSSASTDFDLFNGDFTVEMWVNTQTNPSSPTFMPVVTIGTNSTFYVALRLLSNNPPSQLKLDSVVVAGSTTNICSSLLTGINLTGSWHHIAWCYTHTSTSGGLSNGANTIYVDGVYLAGGSSSVIDNSSNKMSFGANFVTTNGNFLGFMDEVRITKGTNRYPGTTTFTPPSAPFPNS